VGLGEDMCREAEHFGKEEGKAVKKDDRVTKEKKIAAHKT